MHVRRWLICWMLALAACGAGCDPDKGDAKSDSGGPSLLEQYDAAKAIQNAEDRTETLIAVGLKQAAAADADGADASFTEASLAIESIRSSPGTRARLDLALAAAYQKTGGTANASRTLDAADGALKSLEDPTLKINDLATLAGLRFALGDTDAAMQRLAAAEQQLDKIASPLERVDAYATLARQYDAMKKQDEAERILRSAVAMGNAQQNPNDRIRVLLRVATAQQARGQKSAAVAMLGNAEKLVDAIEKNPLLKAHMFYEVALAASDLGEPDKCRQLLNEADEEAKKTPEGADVQNKVKVLRQKLHL